MVAVPTFDYRAANVKHTLRPPLAVGVGLTNTGGAGAASAIVIPANATRPNVLSQIIASLSAAPAAAVSVIVQDGSTEIHRFYLPAAAIPPAVVTFDPPIAGTAGNSMTVTIAAPGGAVVAALNLNAYVLN